MKNKFMLAFVALIVLSSQVCFAAYGKCMPSQQMMGAGCGRLNDEQREFAYKLSPTHRQAFCGAFTDEQREEAMAMSKESQSESTKVSPDESVENVMKNSRMDEATKKQMPQGCPYNKN